VQAHPDLKGDALAKAVDQQPWDPSVKALTAFPSVLGNIDKNLAWTSSLGDAYYNQEQGVMDAVQAMRQRAQEAGNLKTTEQQTVTSQDSTIIIEPPNPEVVYVPNMIMARLWRSHRGVAGMVRVSRNLVWRAVPVVRSRLRNRILRRIRVGLASLGSDWRHRSITYDHDRYDSRSRTFYNRSNYYRSGERAAKLAATTADLAATGAEVVPAAMKGTAASANAVGPAGLKTVPPQRSGLLKETITLLGDTLNPGVRAVRARVPSATTTMAGRKGVFRHAGSASFGGGGGARGGGGRH